MARERAFKGVEHRIERGHARWHGGALRLEVGAKHGGLERARGVETPLIVGRAEGRRWLGRESGAVGEVEAYGHRLEDGLLVLLQHRQLPEGVTAAVRFRPLLAAFEGDEHQLVVETELFQHHLNANGTRARIVIELHARIMASDPRSKQVPSSGRPAKNADLDARLRPLVPDGWASAAYELDDAWAGAAEACGGSGFYLIDTGRMWLEAEGETTEVVAGDVVMMSRVVAHRVSSRPRFSNVHLDDVMAHTRDVNGWRRLREGGSSRMHAVGLGRGAIPRLPGVRPLLVVRRDDRRTRTIVDALRLELDPSHGTPAVAEALVRALWLKVLTDQVDARQLDIDLLQVTEAALDDVEAFPHAGRLAEAAGLSRSRFSERFRACYGEPPARWLRRARMKRAHELLSTGAWSVAQVAERLGFASESAFRKSFKRVMGHPARAT